MTAPGTERSTRPKVAKERRWFGRESLLAYALLLPSLVVFAVFVYYPFAENFRLGFYSSNPANPSITTYAGWSQWSDVLDLPRLGRTFGIGAAIGLAAAVLVVVARAALRRTGTGTGTGAQPLGRLRIARRLGGTWLLFAVVIGLGSFAFGAGDGQSFAHSLKVTIQFWLLIVPPTIVLGLLVAVLGHRRLKGIGVFRTFFMMSLASGVGVAGTIFFTLLNPQVGLLPWLGVDTDPPPLQNPTWALFAVAVFVWWLELGSAFIFLSAGLQNIPDQLEEAAMVDGAGAIRRFFQITLPLLSPMLVFVFVLGSVLGLVQSFPIVDVTTGGDPIHRTETLAWLIVDATRGTSQDYGKAAILSVALFLLAFALTLVQLTFLERRVSYGEGSPWVIRIAAVLVGSYVAIALLLAGLVDIGLRPREDFATASRGSRRRWALTMVGLPALAVVPYLLSGREQVVGLAIPVVWLAVELLYFTWARPRLREVRPVTWSRLARTALLYAALVSVAAVLFFPFYITAVNSLLRGSEITHRPPTLFPFDPQWDSYSRAWTNGHLGRYLFNSAVMTVIIVVAQVVTSVLAAYAFAFLRFPFKRLLFLIFLGTLMLPFEVTIVTNLRIVSDMGLYNTYLGMAIPFLASGFGTFVMRQAFLSLPTELHDAAMIDGFSHLRYLWRIAVPLTRPSIAALTVFSFLGAWSQYLWPYLISKENLRTVQVGVKELRNTQFDRLNVVFAGLMIAALPLVILLIVFQKQLIRGLTAGAVKG